MELDTTKLVQAGQRKLTPHDNCIVLDVGTGTFPRLVELRLPGIDGARQSALWDGSIDLAVDDIVIADEYSGQTVWRISSMGGGDSGAGKTRVSQVWESDFGNVILTIGTTGQTIFQPAVDSTTFFQILDTDGGTPIVNVDSTNEFVGIGTSSPASALQIASGDLSLDNNQGILFKDSVGTLRTFFTIDGSDILFVGPAGSPAGTTTAIKFRPGGATAMTIDEGGDIGIGIETMLASLHVRGNATDRGYLALETATGTILAGEVVSGIKFISGDGSTPAPTDNIVAKIEAIAQSNHSASNFDTGLAFFTNDNVTTTERMRIDKLGNVGINGVTSPSTELDIGAGAIEFDEMTAPGAGAANTARLYAVDNGAGKTQLIVIFSSGAAQVLATQP